MVTVTTNAQREAAESTVDSAATEDVIESTDEAIDSTPNEWEELAADEGEASAALEDVETAGDSDEPKEVTETEEPAAESEDEPAAKEEEVAPAEVSEDTPKETVEDVVVPAAEVPEAPKALTDAEVATLRQQATEELTAQFSLTDEEDELMLSNPGQVLPKLAANMYLNIYDGVMQAVQAQIPHMVAAITQQRADTSTYEQKFFNAWPQLAKSEYRATVERISTSFRDLNPSASESDVIQEVGAQAWVALRLPIEELLSHTTKAAPVTEQEVLTPAQRPAGAATRSEGSRPTSIAPEGNIFEQFAETFDD